MGLFFKAKDVKKLLEAAFPGERFTCYSAVLCESKGVFPHRFALGINEHNLYLVRFKPLSMKFSNPRIIPLNKINKVIRNPEAAGFAVRITTREGDDFSFQSLNAIGYDMPQATSKVIEFLKNQSKKIKFR